MYTTIPSTYYKDDPFAFNLEDKTISTQLESMDGKLDKLAWFLIKQNQELKEQNKNLLSVIEKLRETNHGEMQVLQEKVSILVNENERLEKERKAKKEEQMRRKLSKTRSVLRAPIEKEDYDTVMECVQFKCATKCSFYKVALTVLFLTGVRVGNLKTIYKEDLEQLYNKKDFIMRAIKSKDKKVLTFPSSKAYNFYLAKREEDFIRIFKSIPASQLVWTVSREHLTREINLILKRASVLLKKNLKSHSFRIGVATAVADKYTIYEAQAILGHARISTTEKYVQSRLSKRDKTIIANSIFLNSN